MNTEYELEIDTLEGEFLKLQDMNDKFDSGELEEDVEIYMENEDRIEAIELRIKEIQGKL